LNNQTTFDPYNTNQYQATLTEQKKHQVFSVQEKDTKNKKQLMVVLTLHLNKNGVEVIYEPDFIKFESADKRTQFQREINGFFLINGFVLENIHEDIFVFRCGTDIAGDKSTFHFDVNESIIEEDDAKELIRIFSMQIHESSLL